MLFVLAIELLKAGASALGPVLSGRFEIEGVADGLGLGWLTSYALLSGSPAASSGLALLGSGVIDRWGAYGVVAGSRFGASFIVLLLGLVYVMRGRDRTGSLAIGVVAVAVSASQQLLALPLGLALMNLPFWDALVAIDVPPAHERPETWFGPLMDLLANRLPSWLIFLGGLGMTLFSLRLFDRALPPMRMSPARAGRFEALAELRWPMFVIGGLVTMITMSVSVSLGILVPLHIHAQLRRDQVVPYVLGANVSTFSDTFVAALLIGHPEAVPIVAIEVLSLAAASAFLLIALYQPYRQAMLAMTDWALKAPRNLGLVVLAMILLPIGLFLG